MSLDLVFPTVCDVLHNTNHSFLNGYHPSNFPLVMRSSYCLMMMMIIIIPDSYGAPAAAPVSIDSYGSPAAPPSSINPRRPG